MDIIIRKLMKNDLTGEEILSVVGDVANLVIYKDLLNYNSILEVFGNKNSIVLLFPVESNNVGHYIALLKNDAKKTITHFDSYGINASQEIGYTSNIYVKRRLLNILYANIQRQGWTVTFNTFKLQQFGSNISTCGRWCCSRVLFSYLSDKQFAKMFYKQKYSPDELVTLITFIKLNEENIDKNTIYKSLI